MSAIIFSGPPCTGKSTIAACIAKKVGATHLEMDFVRLRLIPDSHTAEIRQIAYRAIHLIAEHLLTLGHSVILDATYGPFSSRRDLADVIARTGAQTYLIQCRLEADEAARRFRLRSAKGEVHAATDLDETRVATLAGAFPFANTGILLNTATPIDESVQVVLSHLSGPEQFDVADWLRDPGGQRI